MDEAALSGGSVSEVVRVGNTVRRRRERWSSAVHGVLSHLEDVGFDGAPRLLGVDDRGREILSWEIICHGDLGPWNINWRDNAPVALIDWDFAAPAQPLVNWRHEIELIDSAPCVDAPMKRDLVGAYTSSSGANG